MAKQTDPRPKVINLIDPLRLEKSPVKKLSVQVDVEHITQQPTDQNKVSVHVEFNMKSPQIIVFPEYSGVLLKRATAAKDRRKLDYKDTIKIDGCDYKCASVNIKARSGRKLPTNSWWEISELSMSELYSGYGEGCPAEVFTFTYSSLYAPPADPESDDLKVRGIEGFVDATYRNGKLGMNTDRVSYYESDDGVYGQMSNQELIPAMVGNKLNDMFVFPQIVIPKQHMTDTNSEYEFICGGIADHLKTAYESLKANNRYPVAVVELPHSVNLPALKSYLAMKFGVPGTPVYLRRAKIILTTAEVGSNV